jgi:hypothetical protein
LLVTRYPQERPAKHRETPRNTAKTPFISARTGRVWSRACLRDATAGYVGPMGFLLWLAAVILVIAGIITLFKGGIILGIILIIVGFAVGPGGWSVFKRR